MVDAARALREHRDIHCIFVEEDPGHWEQLKAMLTEFGDDDSETLRGRLEDHLDEILSKTAGKSLHVFLDPYGPRDPLRMLADMLRRRPRKGPHGFQPTEIILNFSINGITRAAGRLDRRYADPAIERARETRLRGLEEFLDGQWWHAIWRAGRPDRVAMILEGHLEPTTPATSATVGPSSAACSGALGATRPACCIPCPPGGVRGCWPVG